MWRRILYVVFVLFCIELGLFLVVLPWSELWERNLLIRLVPSLRPILLSDYVRGAFSGLGLVNLWVAASDIWNFRRNIALLERREKPAEAASASVSGTVSPNSGKADEPAPNPLLHH